MSSSQIANSSVLITSKHQSPPGCARLGVICDLVEENWPSMDLIADMLLAHLRNAPSTGFEAERIRPQMSRRFTWTARTGSKVAFGADRFFNRFWDYPRFLRAYREAFDVFHVVDHSYAQLVLELPAERTLVTCHDTETFRCLLDPGTPRSALFRGMVRRILRGLRTAAVVVCPSVATYDELSQHDLIPKERLRVVPLGAHPTCSALPDPTADLEAIRLLGEPGAGQADLLHVGSTVPRKRIESLLRIFAQVRKRFPKVRLIHVGGPLTPVQESIVDELQLRSSVLVLPWLDREILAAVYRRAMAVVLPSAREGFGLPVVEAMACGTPVVASDLPALREVGGEFAVYCPVGKVADWSDAISALLRERDEDPDGWQTRRNRAVARSARFTWTQYTRRMVAVYREVLAGANTTLGEFAS